MPGGESEEREGEDEFDNFYRQYRGQSSGYQGGIQENQSVRGFQRVPSEHIGVSGFQRAPSEHSGSISGTSRASLPRSMFGGFGVRQGQGQGSLWGGGSTSGSYASCTSFTTNGYQSQPAPARNPFLGRSRSQGRDPRLTDLFRAGYGRDAEDTLSRDSGCSSANFEESEAYFAPIAGEEVANRGTGSLLSGQRGKGGAQGPVRGIIRQQSFPRESYPSGYYGLGEDSMSLQEGGVRGWDSLSLRSLDSQPLSWSPLSSECRPRITAKRKRSTASNFGEREEVESKRPRTPSPHRSSKELVSAPPSGSQSSKLAKLCKLLLSFIGLLLLLVLLLLALSSLRALQCSHHSSLMLTHVDLSSLHGQPLAARQISSVFSASPLPSLLLMVGPLGTGKTYAASLLAKSFPVEHNIHAPHAPPADPTSLSSLIHRSCGLSFVILDDVNLEDKVTVSRIEGLLLAIAGAEDTKSNGTMVIVTSTTGSKAINSLVGISARVPSSRDLIELEEVERALVDHLPLNNLREKGLSVVLVPFLPLSRDHVRLCIQQQLVRAGSSMTNSEVNALLDTFTFLPQSFPVFSQTGCKQVASRVDLFLGGRSGDL